MSKWSGSTAVVHGDLPLCSVFFAETKYTKRYLAQVVQTGPRGLVFLAKTDYGVSCQAIATPGARIPV